MCYTKEKERQNLLLFIPTNFNACCKLDPGTVSYQHSITNWSIDATIDRYKERKMERNCVLNTSKVNNEET